MAATASGTQALVIVESPTKARTIRKFLGQGFTVEASMGHVRDLPSSAAEIPAEVKDKSWARLAVDVDHGFKPVYVVPDDKKKVVAELKKALKQAEVLYVATDEDREGESIGWHLIELLRPKIPTHRMVFHEITKDAIESALQNPRAVDEQLVQAQEARRVLDRLVGYTVSPLLWKKVRPRLSAGRVQSVAVRLLVMRERERMAFVAGSWWDLKATAEKTQTRFDAQLVSVGGKPVASGRDFDEATGRLIPGRDVLLLDEGSAGALRARLDKRPLRVVQIERKVQDRSPYPPFTTSTLQQEANRKLGFTARTTMQVAQRLYENGHITYMRTDSVNLSGQAIGSARAMIERRYGAEFLSPKPRNYTTKAKGAQEAHEAIRPAGTSMATASELGLAGPEARLYDLIWKRTVSTQMANAKVALTTARLVVDDPQSGAPVEFRASGRQVVFPGFFRAYVEGTDDPEQVLDDRDQPLPELEEGEQIALAALEALGHETRPRARYTEATLVKALETEGIGRPSTYASIIDTIQQRGYVRTIARQLVPTFTAMAVTKLLEETLGKVVDIEFTASMESWLDDIAEGTDAEKYLDHFYRAELLDPVNRGEQIDARTVCTLESERFAPYRIRIGRYGPFVEYDVAGEEKPRSFSLPEDCAPADVDKAFIDALREKAEKGEAPLGEDPDSGQPVYVRTGRFGPYIQLGEVTDDNPKPKRASLPPKMEVGDVDLETALSLLSLPRALGAHPEDGKEISAGIGRFGPYVKHERIYASLKPGDDVLTVGLARALELIAEKMTRGGAKAEPLRELGAHPDGAPVVVLKGRYGPYVKHGKTNVTLPEGTTVESVSLEQAVALVDAKAAKKGGRKAPAKKGATKKAAGEGAAKKAAGRKKAAALDADADGGGEAAPKKAKKAAPKKAGAKKAAPKKAAGAKKAAAASADDASAAPPAKTAPKKAAGKAATAKAATAKAATAKATTKAAAAATTKAAAAAPEPTSAEIASAVVARVRKAGTKATAPATPPAGKPRARKPE
ncbi:MAG: type I DNA topoisomerase [bacterium]